MLIYKYFFKPCAVVAVLATFSCSSQLSVNSYKQSQDNPVVAKYKDGVVTKNEINDKITDYNKNNPKAKIASFDDLPTAQKEVLIKDLVLQRVTAKRARSLNLNNEDDYKKVIFNTQLKLLQTKLYFKLIADASDEKNVKAKYDDLVLKLKDKEDLKIALIVVKTEDAAQKIYKRLQKNRKLFSYLVKTKSIDKQSKKNKGVIDYSIETSFPTNIVTIIKSLQKGQIAKPLAIGDNWAVVKLINKRSAKINSFALSKNKLSQSLSLKAVEDFNKKALKEAEISLIVE